MGEEERAERIRVMDDPLSATAASAGRGQGPRGEVELHMKIAPEELDKRLEEHGLPRFVFAGDRPLLELQANKPNGKGSGGSGE
jgi:hypothetical protein